MNIYQDEYQSSLKRVCLDVLVCSEKNQQYEGFQQNCKRQVIEQINFKIKFTRDNEIQYIKDDGQIIKTNKYIEILSIPEIMTNLEQINHLQWLGVYSNDFKKVGRWSPIWKGSALSDFGGWYTQDGKKFGKWKELFKTFSDNAQVYEVGDYYDDIKTGDWKFFYEEKQIGGGQYDDQGLKYGLWVDLSDYFWNQNQILYKGYYRKGQKIGLWQIIKNGNNEEFELIGGGLYNEQGQKNGKWEDLGQDFNQCDKVFYEGEYLNGIKIGRWNIKYREIKGDEQIAGGYYNDKGQKEGQWQDLFTNFQKDSKVFFKGGYNQNGERVGRWEIIFKDQKIGGGIFDRQGFKVGHWVELSDRFQDKSQIIYHGEYIQGKRFGRWDISFKKEWQEKPEWIGGGIFTEQGQKDGRWTEICDQFDNENQFIFEGYYKNGKKQGLWDLYDNNEWIYIGGGVYDNENLKNGKWIDYNFNFGYLSNQASFEGVYQNGKKIDRWDIKYKEMWSDTNQKIGGGLYNKDSQKCGLWIDLIDNFKDDNQIIQQGEYLNGIKIGKWDINQIIDYIGNTFNRIGGGQYDQYGHKQGQWVQLWRKFSRNCPVIFSGQFTQNKKIGNWLINYRNEQIGGGFYDEFSQKNGHWIELSDFFKKDCKILSSGNYQYGQKVGKWNFNYKGWGKNKYKKIGGGLFSQLGLKEGKWKVVSENFREDSKVIYKGEYKNGRKYGRWEIKYRGRQDKYYQEIGNGLFNEEGQKNGLWVVLSDSFCDLNQILYSGEYDNGRKVGKWIEDQAQKS
ncbi:unnamed protein product [Paramecium sonneborni]|uniref:Uncharacterized protein n=1 Tax=Paramecium sonneborni TaxID=65129 RepID=A0A8S1PV91_9CILI|nr:unnamed protein product [Paramecium sonneborni]